MVLRPRGRERAPADVLRLLLGLALLGVSLLATTVARNTVGGIEADIVEAYDHVPDRIAEVLTALAFVLAAAVPLLAILVLVVRHRYRRALALLLGGYIARWVMIGLDRVLSDRGVVERVRAETGGDVELTDPRFATASLIASVVAMVVIGSPWLPRAWRRALWSGVTLLVLLRMVSSGEPAFDVALALAVGLVVGSAALVLIGTPSPEPAARELLGMVGRLGPVARIEQRPGSEPLLYRVELAGGERLRLAVRTARDRSADLLARLWRYARLRSAEVDQPHLTVQRRVEHEALAQTLAATGGARVRAVRAVVASPNGSVGLLSEAAEGVLRGHARRRGAGGGAAGGRLAPGRLPAPRRHRPPLAGPGPVHHHPRRPGGAGRLRLGAGGGQRARHRPGHRPAPGGDGPGRRRRRRRSTPRWTRSVPPRSPARSPISSRWPCPDPPGGPSARNGACSPRCGSGCRRSPGWRPRRWPGWNGCGPARWCRSPPSPWPSTCCCPSWPTCSARPTPPPRPSSVG